jgi:hypothetical protein
MHYVPPQSKIRLRTFNGGGGGCYSRVIIWCAPSLCEIELTFGLLFAQDFVYNKIINDPIHYLDR